MSTWFWVATGTTAVNFATANWATSSGGTASGQPTTGDIAILDGGSSTPCTIAASVSLAALDTQGGTGNYTGTLVHNSAVTVTISAAGNGFRLNSGMVYSPVSLTSALVFSLTTGTAGITSGGNNLTQVTLSGVGGTVQQKDNLSITAITNSLLTISNGTWDCNNSGPFTLTVSQLNITGATARTLILAGTLTVGGNIGAAATLFSATTTNFTLTKNSANLVINGPFLPMVAANLAWGGLTFNNVTFNPTANNLVVAMTGNLTCSQFNVGKGWSFLQAASATITCATAPDFTGFTNMQPFIWTSSGTSTAIFSCPSGAVIFKWAVLNNITLTGGATYTGSDCLIGGTVGGITPTMPGDPVTPAANATAIWQDLLSTSDFTTAGSVGALLKAIANLQFTVPAIGRGTVGASASTTSIPTSAFTPAGAVANQFAGRVVLFDAATATSALRGQAAVISASTNASTPTLTVSALTTAPSSGDTFSVL